jgi:hypothetical protein
MLFVDGLNRQKNRSRTYHPVRALNPRLRDLRTRGSLVGAAALGAIAGRGDVPVTDITAAEEAPGEPPASWRCSIPGWSDVTE